MELETGILKAFQIIGYESGGEKQEGNIVARSYTNTGEVSVYTYELEDNTLTIWNGPKDSPTFSKSRFTEDGNSLKGAWEWPGGGYQFEMTRMS